jgi:hypothetical protein
VLRLLLLEAGDALVLLVGLLRLLRLLRRPLS